MDLQPCAVSIRPEGLMGRRRDGLGAVSAFGAGLRWGARRARSARSAGPHRGAPRGGEAALEPVWKVLTGRAKSASGLRDVR